jgi:hypothetical protein
MRAEDTGISAVEFLPTHRTLASLREAARGCRDCHLYQDVRVVAGLLDGR